MTETKTEQKLYNKSVNSTLSNGNNKFTELMNYSPIELKDYDQERHVSLNQAYNLLSENEILVDKFGTDVIISIDNLADQTYNIGKPQQTQKEKIQARILYDNSKVSSIAS